MVNHIYELKNKIIDRIETDINQRGIDRINVNEMGELVDMVKDLAEAESSCWQAEYYKTITEEMKGGTQHQEEPMVRSGYGETNINNKEVIEPLRKAMKNATPNERAKLRSEVMAMVNTR